LVRSEIMSRKIGTISHGHGASAERAAGCFQ
jgi:hypothetical protein